MSRYGTAAAVSVNNCRFVSSSTSKWCDYVPSPIFIESCKSWPNAVSLFESTLSVGCYPISHYNFILSSLLQLGRSETVVSLAQQLEEVKYRNNIYKRVLPDIHTWSILITCHCFHGNMSSAIRLFNNIIKTGHPPSAKTLYDIFDGFCRIGKIHKAILFYNDIVLQGFQLENHTYSILIQGVCEIGETQVAIQLLRQALRINSGKQDAGFSFKCMYNSIILRLCKDRLANQAYDLYSEMIHTHTFKPDVVTYHHLIYGYCILGQFEQAIALFKKFKASLPEKVFKVSINIPPTPPTQREVKSAKTAVAVMIKGGLKPNIASYHSVADGIYNFGSRRLMNKIAHKMERLVLLPKSLLRFEDHYYY